MRPPLTVIVNAASGTAKKEGTVAALKSHFLALGTDAKIVLVRDGATLVDHTRRAIAEGCQTVVAAGGDGTVNAMACVVASSEVTLGVLPLGTLNHFAKDLGIPLELEQAVRTLVDGQVKHVDVGQVNDHVFVNNSSLGLYPTIVKQRQEQQRLGRGKWSAFLRAVLTVLGRYPLIKVRLEIDGKVFTRKTPLAFVGNNEYHIQGLKLGSRDRLDGGVLSVYLTRDVGRLKLIGFALRALLGRLRPDRDFEAVHTTAVSIVTRRWRLRVAIDGEVRRLRVPLDYRIRPGALRVIVPAASQGPGNGGG